MTHVATIPKNSREELRITLEEFRGHRLLNLRVWYEAEDRDYRPAKKGAAFKAALLPDVLGALEHARDMAPPEEKEDAA